MFYGGNTCIKLKAASLGKILLYVAVAVKRKIVQTMKTWYHSKQMKGWMREWSRDRL